MRIDVLMPAWVARLNADSALTALLGAQAIYPAQAARPVRVPSAEWMVSGDVEGESFNRIFVQWDLFVRGAAAAMQAERRFRLSHDDGMQDLGGLKVWIRYLDSRTIEFPSDPGVMHRALDFEIETVRGKYGNSET